MTAPSVAWVQVEQAIRAWVADAVGLPLSSVYFVESAELGQSPPPVPAIQIQNGAMVPRFQPEARTVPSVMLARVTVGSAGPGVAGVLFYPGDSLDAQTIAVVAVAGEPVDTIAAALLAELDASLPAGYSAAADPDDPASVIVSGSDVEPLFAMVASAGLASVTIIRERFPVIDCAWTRFGWRVVFRSAVPRGPGSPADMLASARMTMHRKLAPALHAAGQKLAGVTLAAPNIPADREEFRAALDFNTEGFATRAYQAPTIRQIGIN